MCGHDWCSVRISREIQEIASGKEAEYAWDKPKISEALTQEQRDILQQRGVLSPEEIHKLATKTKRKMKQGDEPAACHSDRVDNETAQAMQSDAGTFVELNTAPAHNLPTHDNII